MSPTRGTLSVDLTHSTLPLTPTHLRAKLPTWSCPAKSSLMEALRSCSCRTVDSIACWGPEPQAQAGHSFLSAWSPRERDILPVDLTI